jgi:hypothetical protein
VRDVFSRNHPHLDPTLLICHGKYPSEGTKKALGPNGPPVLPFVHPSAPDEGWWCRSANSSYLVNTVGPEMQAAMRQIEGGAARSVPKR